MLHTKTRCRSVHVRGFAAEKITIMNFLRMEWIELHDLNLCEEVLVVEPWKHSYRSKERGDL